MSPALTPNLPLRRSSWLCSPRPRRASSRLPYLVRAPDHLPTTPRPQSRSLPKMGGKFLVLSVNDPNANVREYKRRKFHTKDRRGCMECRHRRVKVTPADPTFSDFGVPLTCLSISATKRNPSVLAVAGLVGLAVTKTASTTTPHHGRFPHGIWFLLTPFSEQQPATDG